MAAENYEQDDLIKLRNLFSLGSETLANLEAKFQEERRLLLEKIENLEKTNAEYSLQLQKVRVLEEQLNSEKELWLQEKTTEFERKELDLQQYRERLKQEAAERAKSWREEREEEEKALLEYRKRLDSEKEEMNSKQAEAEEQLQKKHKEFLAEKEKEFDARQKAFEEENKICEENVNTRIEAFAMEKQRMNQIKASTSDLVDLNVGGRKYKLRRATLCLVEGSLLASMFSGRWEDGLERTSDGAAFLDFDPSIFDYIVQVLRLLATNEVDSTHNKFDCRASFSDLTDSQFSQLKSLVHYLGLDDVFLLQNAFRIDEHNKMLSLREYIKKSKRTNYNNTAVCHCCLKRKTGGYNICFNYCEKCSSNLFENEAADSDDDF